MPGRKTVIIIAGATAVGKTAVAISMAKQYNTEIISADSRQCYKELTIGVAKPSENELKKVTHYFISTHSIHQKVTAATFEEYALEKAENIFTANDIVVLTGGTGLYLKAFCEGLDAIPQVPDELRNGIVEGYEKHGLFWLQQHLQVADPVFYKEGDIQNPQRCMRALEVVKATGKSIITFKKGSPKKRSFNIIKIALDLPKEELHATINNRVDRMMRNGLAEEVESLIPHQSLNALQTVGYKELFHYFDGKLNVAQAIELIKTNTRQYAKRQGTWFRKDKDFVWFNPHDEPTIIDYLSSQITL